MNHAIPFDELLRVRSRIGALLSETQILNGLAPVLTYIVVLDRAMPSHIRFRKSVERSST